MPGDMPYYLEKGPYLTGIEHYLTVEANAAQALLDLRDGAEIPEIGGVLDSLGGGPLTVQQLKDVIYRDWFGRVPDPSQPSGWGPQPGFHPVLNPTTGYWQQYYGDVEKIVRETLIRALEVSLGVDREQSPPSSGPTSRHWPIELWWKCGQGWFEGWVTWHNDQHQSQTPARDAGQVTVILATPGTGYQVLEDPTQGRVLPNFEINPASTKRPGPGERFQGSWVVTHNKQQKRFMLTTEGKGRGDLVFPLFGPGYVGTNEIVCVQPSWADGGTQN